MVSVPGADFSKLVRHLLVRRQSTFEGDRKKGDQNRRNRKTAIRLRNIRRSRGAS